MRTVPAQRFSLEGHTHEALAQRVSTVEDDFDTLEAAWSDWSPSWTNLSVGDGTVTARYKQTGATVHSVARLVFGSSTTVTGSISVSVPAAPLNTGFVVVQAYDTDVDTPYLGWATLSSSTDTVTLMRLSGGTTNWNATTPFTWATGDVLHIGLAYEADV